MHLNVTKFQLIACPLRHILMDQKPNDVRSQEAAFIGLASWWKVAVLKLTIRSQVQKIVFYRCMHLQRAEGKVCTWMSWPQHSKTYWIKRGALEWHLTKLMHMHMEPLRILWNCCHSMRPQSRHVGRSIGHDRRMLCSDIRKNMEREEDHKRDIMKERRRQLRADLEADNDAEEAWQRKLYAGR